jgi:hypothetical protein
MGMGRLIPMLVSTKSFNPWGLPHLGDSMAKLHFVVEQVKIDAIEVGRVEIEIEYGVDEFFALLRAYPGMVKVAMDMITKLQ